MFFRCQNPFHAFGLKWLCSLTWCAQEGDAMVPTRDHCSNAWTAGCLFLSTVSCVWLYLVVFGSLEDCSTFPVTPGLQLSPMSKTIGTSFRDCWCCAKAEVAEQVCLIQISQKSRDVSNGAQHPGLLSYFLRLVVTTYCWISTLKLDELNLSQPKGHMTALPFSRCSTILISSYLYSSHTVSELVLSAD